MIWRYINLKNDYDRRKNIENFFIRNLILFKRINAVSGNEINEYLTEEVKNKSMIGCLISHLNAIKDFYLSGEEFGIICEDDLDEKYFKYHKINKIINGAPKDWEIIQLSYSLSEIPKTFLEKNKYLNWKKSYYGTMSYVINRKGAKKILDKIFVDDKIINYNFLKMASDYVLFETSKTYTYYLSIFITKLKFKSNISNDYETLEKYNYNCLRIYQFYGILK